MKPFFKTSEFWISFFFLLATVASVVASTVPPATGLKVGAFAVGCYALARGLAKLSGGPDLPPLFGLNDLQSKTGQNVLAAVLGLPRARTDQAATDGDDKPVPFTPRASDDESGPEDTPAKE